MPSYRLPYVIVRLIFIISYKLIYARGGFQRGARDTVESAFDSKWTDIPKTWHLISFVCLFVFFFFFLFFFFCFFLFFSIKIYISNRHYQAIGDCYFGTAIKWPPQWSENLTSLRITVINHSNTCPACILYKSIADRYRSVSYPNGPITACYRFL